MYFKRFFYFFVFFTFFSVGLSAQEYFFDVEIINVEQGLPSRRTYSVVQDLDGFIWVSTPGKISRYDGYNFRNYTSDRLKINESLPTFLAVDDAGLLWYCEYPSYSITNETGIIDTKINKIQNIEIFSKGLIKGDAVSKISNSDVSAAILIETKNGIIYSYESGEFSVVFKFEEPYAAKIPCALKEFEKGVYWIGKGSDLYKIEGEQIMEQIYVPHNIIDIEPFKKTYVIKTLTSTDRKLWKLENKKVIPFSMNNLNEPNLTHVQNTFNNHYFLCSDKIIFKNKANQIIYEHDNIAQIAILENKSLKLQNLFIDRQNIHWLTTENGLIKVTIQKNHFQVLERKNSIRGIYEDKNDLWIGGYFKNISGSETDELSKILTKNSVAMVGFTKDKSGDLWIGTTADLLLKYDKKKKIFEQFSQGSNALLLPYYNSQLEKIFIGQENGISVYDLKTKRISSKKLPINSDAVEVRQFLEKENDVWIVSSKGLLVMNKQTGDIYNHFSKEDGFLFENFNHLHIDKRGVFWIGTRGNGLIRWNRNNNKIKVFSRENGLSNNNIYAVYEDDFNSLWLPTDYGLNRFNKSTFETRTFLPKDGIAHEEFNTFSHFKDKNGRLYFGGLSGITTFHPKDFTKFQYRPILEVISIEKLGQDELFSEEILEEYNREKTIKLNYNNQNLSFNLALLDFMNPEDNQYAYRLNGINNKWIYTENNVISFNNLPSGRYRLSLKAKGALGNYSDKMLSIPIIIKPPFYKELWFLISSFLVFVVSVYLLFRLRIKRLEIDRIRLETEVAKRTDTILKQTEELKALDKVKTQFFSNITHEFRTPLTLIIGPLEQLLNSKIQGETKEKVKGIHRNANQLRDLINQLLDLSKIESGKMKIELTHGDIINYTKELTENFRFLAEYKNQTLQFISDLEIWETNFDKEKWHKIVFNLLSNAIKFTPEKGVITIELSKRIKDEETLIFFKISDTGIGIEKEEQVNVFKRFYQTDASTTRIQNGTGLGLALVKELILLQKGSVTLDSEVDKGTSFLIIIPIQKVDDVEIISPKTKVISSLEMALITNKVQEVLDGNTVNGEKSDKLELLIIEDNYEMRNYIKSCIDDAIYNISEAENGAIGIQKAIKLIPDIIISDVMMPEKDGFEVTQILRQKLETSHIPIVLLTAKSSLESRLEGLEYGVDAYLVKPFSPKELMLIIKNLIENRLLIQRRFGHDLVNKQKEIEVPVVVPHNQKDDFVKAIKVYINENIEDYQLNGESIAKHFSISRMQLHRKLKALTNSSISVFIRNQRLKNAIELMDKTKMNISEIAYETGFSSPAHFSKTFKKEMGKTPSKYLEDKKQA